ncbi:FtsQ-type POTRA domain-containing protein [Nocardioides sp. BP30]|uniref:cell division protein FtsQ/DivIB n=1 Tax=Nocardioides sp. BP30 TaxID=3036374 RepID=UPI0024693958|nr:FtsQ-type POTRA domain-containing protein [Nocardioides sp. BP30]WGL53861.1 FtsQ-type POTRA domain-containing protein [Nocardioides sp. BP30]
MPSLRRRAGTGAAEADTAERTRRRFARRQWRRRWLAWRYVVAVLVVLLLVAGGLWAAYFSSWLSVKSVDVQGVSGDTTLTSAQIRRAADVPTGGPLLRANLAAVQRRVAALAAVKSVDVSREWPSKVRIDVVERTPVAVIEIGGALHALDADGVVFSSYKRAPSGLPKVSTPAGTDASALQQAAEVVTALPRDLSADVDHVEVKSVDEISLALSSGKNVQWGSASDSATKAEVLAALMKAKPDARTYDVSVPGQPVTSG